MGFIFGHELHCQKHTADCVSHNGDRTKPFASERCENNTGQK